MSEHNTSHPRLSVIVATTQPWPELRPCLEALLPQARATESELIAADGSGQGLPRLLPADYEKIVWIKEAGASVFRLRALGVAAARGRIIATTEDHCVVNSDWCARILRAHENRPDAAAIAGPVENGSISTLIDWANFLQTFGAFAPPLNSSQRKRCPTNSNLSYKREVLLQEQLQPGWMELVLNPSLCQEGRVVMDERVTVTHVQSHGLLGTFKAHFHNGRTTTGLGPLGLSKRQLPLTQLLSTLGTIRGKRHLYGRVLACLPWLGLISCCHAAGELVGLMAGPGKSPERLR